jgi:hypothetical protein
MSDVVECSNCKHWTERKESNWCLRTDKSVILIHGRHGLCELIDELGSYTQNVVTDGYGEIPDTRPGCEGEHCTVPLGEATLVTKSTFFCAEFNPRQ